MSTTLKQMARLSNGSSLQRISTCLSAQDIAMMLGGSGLILYGLARRTLPSIGVAAMGAAVIAYASCRNHDDAEAKLRKQVINSPKRYHPENSGDIAELHQTPRDSVDESSMESFPGSDSPAHSVSA
ncbi:MAG TPA: hypothetical protein VFE58_02940 [Tepidisphaeraceae bacterium]|jgi:hypothetical protein|nr:hypothetical protein [Tepidisphaeraceae bacterium]